MTTETAPRKRNAMFVMMTTEPIEPRKYGIMIHSSLCGLKPERLIVSGVRGSIQNGGAQGLLIAGLYIDGVMQMPLYPGGRIPVEYFGHDADAQFSFDYLRTGSIVAVVIYNPTESTVKRVSLAVSGVKMSDAEIPTNKHFARTILHPFEEHFFEPGEEREVAMTFSQKGGWLKDLVVETPGFEIRGLKIGWQKARGIFQHPLNAREFVRGAAHPEFASVAVYPVVPTRLVVKNTSRESSLFLAAAMLQTGGDAPTELLDMDDIEYPKELPFEVTCEEGENVCAVAAPQADVTPYGLRLDQPGWKVTSIFAGSDLQMLNIPGGRDGLRSEFFMPKPGVEPLRFKWDALNPVITASIGLERGKGAPAKLTGAMLIDPGTLRHNGASASRE